MKLTPQQVKTAYDRLLSDPSASIRKLAKELRVSDACLRKRLKEYAGSKYSQFNPPEGSILKLLRSEIVPTLDLIQKKEVNEWISLHCHELLIDNGLLTANQEDRLCHLECLHRRSLDETLPLSEFLSDRIQDGFIYVPLVEPTQKQEDYLEELRPSLSTSYICISDLEEVLADHFNSTLDEVLPKLNDRLYRPLHELHPAGNTLWGQVTSEMIQECLDELLLEESAAIKFHFDRSLESEAALLNSFYFSEFSDFTLYSEEHYFNGLTHLSDGLIQLL